MEKAAAADYYFRTYGWTWQELQECPFWLTPRLAEVGKILNEIEKERLDAT